MGVDSFHPPDSGGLAAREDDLGVALGGVGEWFLFLIFLVIAVGLMIVIVVVEVGRTRRAGLSVLLEQGAEPVHVWAEVYVSPIVTVEILLLLRRIEDKAVVGSVTPRPERKGENDYISHMAVQYGAVRSEPLIR
jgi:hypothetical protein